MKQLQIEFIYANSEEFFGYQVTRTFLLDISWEAFLKSLFLLLTRPHILVNFMWEQGRNGPDPCNPQPGTEPGMHIQLYGILLFFFSISFFLFADTENSLFSFQ
jgi:hypothetical protein